MLLVQFDFQSMKISHCYPLVNILYVFFKNPILILLMENIFSTWAGL